MSILHAIVFHKPKYKSKEEYIKEHNMKMNFYKHYFVDIKKLPLLVKPSIVTFDDINLAGGYWNDDTFYLNCASYDTINKFETSALILHETIPGHHMQLSYHIRSNIMNTTLYGWFNDIINGICEGWGSHSDGHIYPLVTTELLETATFLRRNVKK